MLTIDDFLTRHPEFDPVKLSFQEDMTRDFTSRILEFMRKVSFDDLFTCTVTNRKNTGMKIKIAFEPTIDPPEEPDAIKTREAAWKLLFRAGKFSNDSLDRMARYLHVETLIENFPFEYIADHEEEIYERLRRIHESFFERNVPKLIRGTSTTVEIFYNCLARNHRVKLEDFREFLSDIDPCSMWYNPNIPNETFYDYDQRLTKLFMIGRNIHETTLGTVGKRSLFLLENFAKYYPSGNIALDVMRRFVEIDDPEGPLPRERITEKIEGRNRVIQSHNVHFQDRFEQPKQVPITIREVTRIWFDALKEKSSRFDIIKEGHPSYVTYQAMKKLEKLLYDCGVFPPIPVEEMLFLRKVPETVLQQYLGYGRESNEVFDLNVVAQPSVGFLDSYFYRFWPSQLSTGDVPSEFANMYFNVLDHYSLSLNPYLSEEFFRTHVDELYHGYVFLNPTLPLQFFEDYFPDYSMVLLSLNPLFEQIKQEGTEKRVLREISAIMRHEDALNTLPSLILNVMEDEREMRERRKYQR